MDRPDASRSGTFSLDEHLTVHRLGFGAMRLTGEGVWGEPDDPEEARRVLHRAVELGVNLVDTADAYGPEVSERLIAEALHPYPAGFTVATKGGLLRPEAGEWTPDGRPEHLREAVEGSLRRLRVERIDLYQLHAPDPDVPYAESVGTLADLRREGKIHSIGVSNVDVDQLETARDEAEIVSVQNRYNLEDRDSEPVLEACEADGIGFIPWSPIAAGRLGEGGGTLARVAEERDATPAQVALAWLLARSPVMLPIPGTSSVDHLEENVAAAMLDLSPEEVDALEGAVAV